MFLPWLITLLGAWFGFANPLAQFPAAVVAFPLGLFWIAWRSRSVGRAFRWGFLAAWPACLGVIYWIALPIQQYGGLPWTLAIPCPVGVAGLYAIYYGLWCAAMHYLSRRMPPWAVCLGAGVFWFCLEHVGSFLLTGFPWVALASALAPWPWAVQAASLVGGYGLAGILAALGAALVLAAADRSRRSARYIALGLILFLGLFGPLRLALDTTQDTPPDKTIPMLLVQGDVDQARKWDEQYQSDTVDLYLRLSEEGIRARRPLVVVWPETAMPFYLQDLSVYTAEVLNFVRDQGVWLVAGSPAYENHPSQGTFSLYNRAFLFTPGGLLQGWYDKQHLVPFGEYVPLADILPLEKLTHGVGDYSPGRSAAPLTADGLAMGGLVCYEAIFPDLAQARVEAGATLLVNISNDAWFGDTPAPRQHLGHAVVRCVEQGRGMARATNNGITVCIDHLGRIRERIPQFQPGVLACSVESRDLKTVFHRCYHLLIPAAYLLALALLASARLWPTRRS